MSWSAARPPAAPPSFGWTDLPVGGHDYGSGSTATVKLQVIDDEGDIGEITHDIAVKNRGFNKPHLILIQRYHNLFLILQKILQVLK